MHQSVIDKWHSFSEDLEGRVLTMYLDILGLVTTGVGNLIDPVSEAVRLPWKRSDNTRATEAEIRESWARLKNRPDLAKRHVSHAAALTGLHLTDEDVDLLVAKKLVENERYVTGWLPDFPNLPADAQLGIMSMAWAVGPGFNKKFPTFTGSALKGDWVAAAAACTIREEGNPGVVPRNKRNRICFSNAALVIANGLARDVVHWPNAPEPAEQVPSAPAPTPPVGDDYALAALLGDIATRLGNERRIAAHREMSDLDPEPFPLPKANS